MNELKELEVIKSPVTVRKDEKYIKGLLKSVFTGVGNWQSCEYCSTATNFRADYVILGDNYFKYFEIKSEYDTLDDRLKNQFRGYISTFTHFYLVIPKSSLEKVFAYKLPDGHYGIYLVEELEQGKKEPFLEPIYVSSIDPRGIADLLWVEELKDYVKKLNITVLGKELSVSKLAWSDLKNMFSIFYHQSDSLRILNEVFLTKRKSNL